jgi:hypothetical protein
VPPSYNRSCRNGFPCRRPNGGICSGRVGNRTGQDPLNCGAFRVGGAQKYGSDFFTSG